MARSKKTYQTKEKKIAYQLIIRQQAENNISTAFDWYEEHREGLGNEFLLSIEACFHILQRSPLIYRVRYLNTRAAILKRFPFLVYYLISDFSVVVLAVLHFKQNQKKYIKLSD